MSNQKISQQQEEMLLEMFGTPEEKARYARMKDRPRLIAEALPELDVPWKHKHNHKPVSFDESTGKGVWRCKCGDEVERTAQFMCFDSEG